jgi:hypothetical protein
MESNQITEISSRRRVNIGQTATGKITWECTVELFNKTNKECKEEVVELVNMIQNSLPKGI